MMCPTAVILVRVLPSGSGANVNLSVGSNTSMVIVSNRSVRASFRIVMGTECSMTVPSKCSVV